VRSSQHAPQLTPLPLDPRIPEVNATQFGRKLLYVRDLFGFDNWSNFSVWLGFTRTHALKMAREGHCHSSTLVAIRERTGVSLNWLLEDNFVERYGHEGTGIDLTDKARLAEIEKNRLELRGEAAAKKYRRVGKSGFA
jgi:hypothetical protein